MVGVHLLDKFSIVIGHCLRKVCEELELGMMGFDCRLDSNHDPIELLFPYHREFH
jgi:hypothetical protein